MDSADLDHRFAYHAPPDDATVQAHQLIRRGCRDLATAINHAAPDGREKSLAITSLEEVMMWANAAIARKR